MVKFENNYERYKNDVPYPSPNKFLNTKPNRVDFTSHASFGQELDTWEAEVSEYKRNRVELLKVYHARENEMIAQFYVDLWDEMGWDQLTEKQRSIIEVYIWDAGHSEGLSGVYNSALGISELVDSLLAGE